MGWFGVVRVSIKVTENSTIRYRYNKIMAENLNLPHL